MNCHNFALFSVLLSGVCSFLYKAATHLIIYIIIIIVVITANVSRYCTILYISVTPTALESNIMQVKSCHCCNCL